MWPYTTTQRRKQHIVTTSLFPTAPPEITVEKSWVHACEGYDSELCCTVHGDTNSDMLWYQNSFLLDATERRSMDRKGDKYCLRIRNFQVSDFGNYSCVADNALGRTKKYIEVSGSPGPAIFLSPAYSGYLDLYNLTWTIESIPPLDEIRLLYRKLLVSNNDVRGLPTPFYRSPIFGQFHVTRIICGCLPPSQ